MRTHITIMQTDTDNLHAGVHDLKRSIIIIIIITTFSNHRQELHFLKHMFLKVELDLK
jgi:hypothetical protein